MERSQKLYILPHIQICEHAHNKIPNWVLKVYVFHEFASTGDIALQSLLVISPEFHDCRTHLVFNVR
jgi:hypothetical protein